MHQPSHPFRPASSTASRICRSPKVTGEQTNSGQNGRGHDRRPELTRIAGLRGLNGERDQLRRLMQSSGPSTLFQKSTRRELPIIASGAITRGKATSA